MRLYAFHCGGEQTLRSVLDPFDADCEASIHAPYFSYLIRHPDGDVLFDTGAHPLLGTDARSRLGGTADLYQIAMAPGDDVVSQLKTIGIDPDGIGHVVQSHLYYDHAGGLEFLPVATVYVQREELRFAGWPPVYQQGVYVRQDRCLPGLLWNPDALIESWERIEEMQRRNNAQLILTHDLLWEETVRLAPDQWYE